MYCYTVRPQFMSYSVANLYLFFHSIILNEIILLRYYFIWIDLMEISPSSLIQGRRRPSAPCLGEFLCVAESPGICGSKNLNPLRDHAGASEENIRNQDREGFPQGLKELSWAKSKRKNNKSKVSSGAQKKHTHSYTLFTCSTSWAEAHGLMSKPTGPWGAPVKSSCPLMASSLGTFSH